MKLTAARKKWIQKEIAKYKAQLGIPYDVDVWHRVCEVLDAPKRVTHGRRTSAYKFYGVCYYTPYRGNVMIFLNVKIHPHTERLRETIIHELCHVRFPSMAHTKEFFKIISAVRKGKTYPQYTGTVWKKRFDFNVE